MQIHARRYAYLSIGASVLTMALKFGAFFLTGSVGLFSDAVESVVNLTAGVIALLAIVTAHRPADDCHAYGHGKAEYLSSGMEGALICVAAVGIAYASAQRFFNPQPLEALGTGIVVATAAGAVNFIAARVMLRAAREYDNIVLEADAKHLLTDVWTSAGLVTALGVMLFAPPSWQILDPVLGFVMAVNIVWTGISLVRRSVAGLMDEGLPPREVDAIVEAIGQVAGEGTQYHALRTRRAGAVRFVDFHLLVPGSMTVQHSHDLCCGVEEGIRAVLPGAQITIHVEPREDHASFDGWKVGGLCDRRCQQEEK
ncbi:cation diffusion facilitator family transporter [Desulfomicrobium escambiense]|uniref:cation diffusion facilitator family transporter n=1 Tax=Desulfomicrobium escambiense TaxID=29503 RepID=UPI0003FBE3F4|nr:cation diffusion facilitator family transporter [Desulfomicrobium escambiense]